MEIKVEALIERAILSDTPYVILSCEEYEDLALHLDKLTGRKIETSEACTLAGKRIAVLVDSYPYK